MDEITARRLNQINLDFYAATASDFHATRGSAWRGWGLLLPYLPPVCTVLDVGCGNGRFGAFLADHMQGPFHYDGLDNNKALLTFAQGALVGRHDVTTVLREVDLVEALIASPNPVLSDAQYDLVVLFGVMHHIPGAQNRQHLMRALARCLAPGGVLAFACWRFNEQARFRERIVAWQPTLAEKVEAGDHLLDWKRGTHALRYCHAVDDAEHDALVAASGLQEIARYRADGETGDANVYSVLRA